MTSGLAAPTALELAAAIRQGDVLPTQVAQQALERARLLGPQVGAFVELTPELALEQASATQRLLRTSTERLLGTGTAGSGEAGALPPFAGVPVGIKDLSLVAGVPTRFGSAALPPLVPEFDDGAVTLLRRAGCVIVGKTSTPEIGLPCYTEPETGPPARTPWDLTRSAGGSSGGSAAAVAAGIVPVALGSDGGGSIRIPASACGLVGLKPTRGRISWGPHGVDRAGLASLGVLTRDVRDTAAFLDVLAAPWLGDQFLLPRPRTSYLDACERHPGRLRIGLLTRPVIADARVHPACLEAVRVTGKALEAMGHFVEPAGSPVAVERWDPFRVLWSVGAASVPVPPEAEPGLVPLTRWLRDQGRRWSGVDYANAIADGQLLARDVAEAWAGFDVIVCPTLAQPPAPVGALRNDADPAADFAAQTEFTPWTSLWNLTGAPSVSLPLHWARPVPSTGPAGPPAPVGELPIGVMLGARSGQEEVLLALAARLEDALPWRHRRPPVW